MCKYIAMHRRGSQGYALCYRDVSRPGEPMATHRIVRSRCAQNKEQTRTGQTNLGSRPNTIREVSRAQLGRPAKDNHGNGNASSHHHAGRSNTIKEASRTQSGRPAKHNQGGQPNTHREANQTQSGRRTEHNQGGQPNST